MMPFRGKKSFTRIPRIGGAASRADTMRSYIGSGDAFGTVQMQRPRQTLQAPAAPAAEASARDLRDYSNQSTRYNQQVERYEAPVNRPQGEGAMSAAYVPPPPAFQDPFASFTMLTAPQRTRLNAIGTSNGGLSLQDSLKSQGTQAALAGELGRMLGYPIEWNGTAFVRRA